MTYQRFEDLPVWQAAIALAGKVYDLVEGRVFDGMGDLRNQLQRASLSVSNNIAEGFERGTTADLVWFIYIARGSAGEVRSGLRLGCTRSKLGHLWNRMERIVVKAEGVSRQLRAWADSLQNTDIRGQKHLNEQGRLEYRQERRSVEFLEKLRELTPHLRKLGEQREGE